MGRHGDAALHELLRGYGPDVRCKHQTPSAPCSSGSGGAGAADRSLAALAEELFEETVFKAACSKGVSMRLQRTKDGATQESRIHELAGERRNR